MSLLDNKTKLIEYINENLAPTKDDRHTRGEVFTPLEFINNNMLDSLEKYYKKTYKINIWSCPNKKWFDPAAGMGNFQIALYYKLMNGLRKKIPKKKDRKKHIIEEMLFMLEPMMECFMRLMQKPAKKNGLLYLHLLLENCQL